ncbi:methylated-DNA--[protein]-cysteine S-methyltransferase [Pectinatus frisingensis]|uniref:methylated-DNA--[protein]-cysteine S-methyltransferase n=1 Tax=Pectinatus frisingensis TaxID=865 RepID=UPI0015F4F17B|nr:methylated-DNA--[protein]-cysteine S-methyltransferase [Pectinatus frisingensis]
MKKRFTYETPIGNIYITEEKSAITEISFRKPLSAATKMESLLLREAFTQISEYLSGKRDKFILPLNPSGTAFQKKVWNALLDIPYGQTRSYKEIAEAIGNSKATRAVGMANNKNPIVICIPCHRVIASDGKLCGYAGGVKTKKFLLQLEHDNIQINK